MQAYYDAVDSYVTHLADSVRREYPDLAARLDACPSASTPDADDALEALAAHITAGVHTAGMFGARLDGVGPTLGRIASALRTGRAGQADVDEILHETAIVHLGGVNPHVATPSPFRCTSDHGVPDIAKAHTLASRRCGQDFGSEGVCVGWAGSPGGGVGMSR